MAKEKTEIHSTETKTTQIKASVELWEAFDKWAARMGCLSLPEGLRAAMREVTKFSGQSQANNLPNLTSSV